MQSWSKITHYAGFDWAHDHHEVVIVNRSGKIVADFQIEHTAQGWQRWREQVAALGPGLAAYVENNAGGFASHPRHRGDHRRGVARNLTSVFLCARAVLPIMKRQRYGRIVNLASVVGRGGAVRSPPTMRRRGRRDRFHPSSGPRGAAAGSPSMPLPPEPPPPSVC